MGQELIVDSELKDLLGALTTEEREQLKANIVKDGCALEPLVVWEKPGGHELVLVDGYNRYEICTETGLPYIMRSKRFESRADVIAWMIDHQAGRRNLSKHQLSLLRAAVFEAEKKQPTPISGEEISPSKTLVVQSGQPEISDHEAEKATAKKTGASRSTIKRDVDYKAAFKSLPNDVQRAIESKEVKASHADVEALAEINDYGEQRKIAKAVKAGEYKSVGAALKAKDKPETVDPPARKPANGKPTIDVRKFKEFETCIGKLIRQNTALKDHAGGAEFHETIRILLNESLKTLASWRKSVEA